MNSNKNVKSLFLITKDKNDGLMITFFKVAL